MISRADLAGRSGGQISRAGPKEGIGGLAPDGHWLIGSTYPGPHRDAAQPATAWKRSLDASGVLGEAQIPGTAARMDLATALRSRDGGLLTVGWRTIRRQLLPDIWVARFVLPTG